VLLVVMLLRQRSLLQAAASPLSLLLPLPHEVLMLLPLAAAALDQHGGCGLLCLCQGTGSTTP
jgi:hypothetical protein